jgi:molybdopterin-containing oxidoreductase family membrane subunit
MADAVADGPAVAAREGAAGRGSPKEEALHRPLRGFRHGLVAGSLVTGALTGLLFYSWAYQVRNDIGAAGINRPVFWGFYITNFVFWIGISHAGTLISAILRVTGAEWRRPVTRCAEAITVFALSIGGLFPLIHLGRPWLFWFMIPVPNSRGLWPNFRSPLVWDMMAITTYLTGSVLYLFLPMIPDFAILRDRAAVESPGTVRARLYRVLAMGWRGTAQQWHSLEAGIRAMAVIIIPVAVSVHTIVSWDFAMTLQPMWHSTIFGPYFVAGAIYSGIAVLMVAMYVLRRGLHLEEYLTDKVFNNLGLMFVAFAVIWGYFTFAEHLTVWYGSEPSEMTVFWQRVSGEYGWVFWLMIVLNLVIPLAVLPFPKGRSALGTAVVGLGVLVGMWIERFLIVIGTLRFPRLDFTVGTYSPEWVEIGILIGSFGLFGLLYFLFVQAGPIISIWEVREGDHIVAHRLGEPEHVVRVVHAHDDPAPEATT